MGAERDGTGLRRDTGTLVPAAVARLSHAVKFDWYQTEAALVFKYPKQGQQGWESITHAVLGMAETAGQVAGRVRAMVREGVWRPYTGGLGLATTLTHHEDAREELGQVLWYAGALATELNMAMQDAAWASLRKRGLYTRHLPRLEGVANGPLTMEWYQREVVYAALNDDNFEEHEDRQVMAVVQASLGLTAEAGAVAMTIKAATREGRALDEWVCGWIKRGIGEVIWQASNVASELGLKISMIALANLYQDQEEFGRRDEVSAPTAGHHKVAEAFVDLYRCNNAGTEAAGRGKEFGRGAGTTTTGNSTTSVTPCQPPRGTKRGLGDSSPRAADANLYHTDRCSLCNRTLEGRAPLSRCYRCSSLFCSSLCLEGHREQHHGRELSLSACCGGRGTKRTAEDGERN